MTEIPEPIRNKLLEFLLDRRAIAYLEIDQSETLCACGGHLQDFGLEQLQTNQGIHDQVDFLTGLLEPDALPLDLPFVTTPSGVMADIHLFFMQSRYWVLLLYAEEQGRKQQAVQQKVNDLRLTHDRQTRILNQYLGKEVARRLEQGIENVNADGERRDLTVLFADIRNFTLFSENASPDEVFRVLNIYLGTMIPIVMDHQGVLDKIIGDEIMVIFGMLSEQGQPPRQAVRAAISMLLAVKKLNAEREQTGLPLLEIGIGIATGPVSLGILGSQHRKSITVIGNHVNLASRLQGQASARQIMIDEETYGAMGGEYQGLCVERTVKLKGYSNSLRIYELNLDNLIQ